MPSLDVITDPVAVHLSLNVPDLGRAVEFYAVLFGVPPAKRHPDYAKFEVADPPLVFSLVPHPPGPGASLRHLGLRLTDPAAVAAVRDRLAAAGIPADAGPDGLTVRDPFGNAWVVGRGEGEAPAPRPAAPAAAPPAAPPAAAVVWEHFVSNPVPGRIPHADGTVDEVRLVGTFNAALSDAARTALVADSFRVLRPGGRVRAHGLMGDRPFPGAAPELPGLAALVARIPVQTEPMAALRAAGFVGVQVVKYTDRPWFTHDGVELREVKLAAGRPAAAAGGGERAVLYKGPFARAVADGGHVFPRGVRTAVPAAVWAELRHGPGADGFVFFDPETPA